MTMRVLEASKRLERDSIKCAVPHVPTIKPLDVEAVRSEAERAGRLGVVAERHTVAGGLGEGVATELVRDGNFPGSGRLPDEFIEAGSLLTLHDRHGDAN